MSKIIWDKTGERLYETGCDPVSYTHLDVYKRQLTGLKHFP